MTGDDPTVENFDDFFRTDFPRLVRFLATVGFDQEDARDAAAEAMLAAYQGWATLRNPRAYVRTAALHAASRRAQRDRERLHRSIQGGWLTSDHVNPFATVDDHLDAGPQLLTLMALLPRQQRIVFALHLDGITNIEIARQLDLRAATVGSHLRHARQRLKAALKAALEPLGETGEWPSTATIEEGGRDDIT